MSLATEENFVRLPHDISLTEGKTYDCGAESLQAILEYYKQPSNFAEIVAALYIPGVQGTFPQKLIQFAKVRGYEVKTVNGSYEALCKAIDAGIPAIVLVRSSGNTNHFLIASAYQTEKELIAFEFYKDSKWLFNRQELQEIWKPCGFLQLEFRPDLLSGQFDRARKLEGEGKTAEAIVLYQEVLQTNPKYLKAQLGLGNCYALEENFEQAKQEYLSALENGLKDPELFNNLAELSREEAENDPRVLAWAEHAVAGFDKKLSEEKSKLGQILWGHKLALSLGTLAAIHQIRGEKEAACESLQRSLALLAEQDIDLRQHRLEQLEGCDEFTSKKENTPMQNGKRFAALKN